MTTTRTFFSAPTTNNAKNTSTNNNSSEKVTCNSTDYLRFFQCVFENTDPDKPMFNSCVDEYKKIRKSPS